MINADKKPSYPKPQANRLKGLSFGPAKRDERGGAPEDMGKLSTERSSLGLVVVTVRLAM